MCIILYFAQNSQILIFMQCDPGWGRRVWRDVDVQSTNCMQTPGAQDVAVKLVKKGAPREERVKPLQEAAMHIVSLLEVVMHMHTVGEPDVV